MLTDNVTAESSVLKSPTCAKSGKLAVLDMLRIGSMAAIVYQHLLPMYGRSAGGTRFPNIGQLGVTVFCGLSGYFAFRHVDSDGYCWIRKRLRRTMPTYWVALTIVLLLNGFSHYKPMSVRIVALEYAGLAGLVDGNSRIGQPFWFITLMLLCYGIAFGLRPRPIWIPIGVICAAMFLYLDAGVWYATHVISFLLCGLVAAQATARTTAVAIFVAAIMSVVQSSAWLYPLVSLTCLAVAVRATSQSPSWLAAASEGTYEFFLVHGVVYLALAHSLHVPLAANVVLGTLLAAIAAYCLRAVMSSSGRKAFRYPVRSV